jgi:hypothetical protein
MYWQTLEFCMQTRLVAIRLTIVAVAWFAAPAFAQDAPGRTEQVQFAAGSSGTTVSGAIKGRELVSYLVGAESGQTMAVRLTSASTSIYFNIYEPGRGPGDQALVVSDQLGTNPMVLDPNSVSAELPTSGTYTVSVYLIRAAARRGETADYTLDLSVTGDLGAIVQNDFADGLAGGPDFFSVATSGKVVLNLRSQPSAGAPVVARLARGEVVRNLGCRMNEARSWCNVATLGDPGVEGWVAGDFLIESAGTGTATQLPDAIPVPEQPIVGDSPARPVGGVLPNDSAFTAAAQIACTRNADASEAQCDAGVVRQGNGNGYVKIFWPDDGNRVIYFENGTPSTYDESEADGGAVMTVSREGDTSIVMIGEQRFVIPNAFLLGG